MPYIFKPHRIDVDRVAEVTAQLSRRSGTKISISGFYEAAARNAIREYEKDPENFWATYRELLIKKKSEASD